MRRKVILAWGGLVACGWGTLMWSSSGPVLPVGSNRQLLVDRYVVRELKGAQMVLHPPVRREVAIAPEHPWEMGGVSYLVTFRDGDLFRAWYRADPAANQDDNNIFTCYAESRDGVRWTKPKLGLFEYQGSKENNIVWAGPGGNMSPFRDDNPAASPEERYKAIVRTRQVLALVSPDGIRWRLAQETPVLSDPPFDSHNIAFWDSLRRQYVIYARGVRVEGRLGHAMSREFKYGRPQGAPAGVRWVRRSTSTDFRRWTPLEPILTGDAPIEQFYTNAAIPYDRSPGLYLMFPSRFADLREPKPGWKHGPGVNDIALLTSRDGLNFDRTFMEAFLRPGLDEGNWHERSLYMERGILETAPGELSLYAMENWRLPSVRIRRLTLRTDGFASVRGPYQGGEMSTHPLMFKGSRLFLNFSTSAVGSLRVEMQDEWGNPLPGYSLEECPHIYGDALDRPIAWKGGSDLAGLAGRAVRLRVELQDADLFAFRFGE